LNISNQVGFFFANIEMINGLWINAAPDKGGNSQHGRVSIKDIIKTNIFFSYI